MNTMQLTQTYRFSVVVFFNRTHISHVTALIKHHTPSSIISTPEKKRDTTQQRNTQDVNLFTNKKTTS